MLPITQFNIENNYFDLKIHVDQLLEKFDAHVLSEDERKALLPMLEEWRIIAREKQKVYRSYKYNKNKYLNPFNTMLTLITLSTQWMKESHLFGAYDKKTNKLQAYALVGRGKKDSPQEMEIKFLVTHPNNIRTRCNKERISGAASSLIHAISLWSDVLKIDRIHLESWKGARTFYQHINLKPSEPPSREYWELPLSTKAKDEWIQKHSDSLTLDYADKTEESLEEN